MRPRLLASSEEPTDIQEGDYILLHNCHESFWAQIGSIYCEKGFHAIITSHLQNPMKYGFGDIIQCCKKYIHEIIRELGDPIVSNTRDYHRA